MKNRNYQRIDRIGAVCAMSFMLAVALAGCNKMLDFEEGRYVEENGELVKLETCGDFFIHWSDDVTEEQANVIRDIVNQMVYVQGGSFVMGAQSAHSGYGHYDANAQQDEAPVHNVTLSNYYVGKFEVTQQEWKVVMQEADRWRDAQYGVGDNFPAYGISYDEAVQFVNKLQSYTNLKFRLPTEAEWEYAARAGVNQSNNLYSGNANWTNCAWCHENADYTTHAVGGKQANQLLIADMSGNVAEWCSDYYSAYSSESQVNPIGPLTGTEHVVRGGSFSQFSQHARCTARGHFSGSAVSIGLRLVLTNDDN